MSQSAPGARYVVALPARNEALRLPGALDALDAAAAHTRAGVCVMVLANGCEDATAEVARAFGRGARHARVAVREVDLPDGQRHAGGARRAAVAAARARFGAGSRDLLLTTDADCRLDGRALAHADAAFAGGAAMVLARIDCAPDPWEPGDPAGIAWGTPGVLWRHKVRQLVETLRTGVPASPLIHDDYGAAGIAVRPDAYDRLGGFAPMASDEDRMLVAGADETGLAVDRGSGMAVTALTRARGRAAGGMADAIARNAALASAGAPCLVERADLTLARVARAPCHAAAFARDVAGWERAEAATAKLGAVIARYGQAGAA